MGNETRRDPGSFRDPSGHIHQLDGRIYRTVTDHAIEEFEFVRDSGFYARMVEAGKVVAATPVDDATHQRVDPSARVVVEHPKLPIVSYPYEWTFSQLKAAALLHLELQIEALANGIMMSDATAFNVQFIGASPIFIDTLSFRRYREGEYWDGHKQFQEQFLIPLLLRSLFGSPHNAWFRGAQEGIPRGDFVNLLRFGHKLSWRVLSQLVLPNRFERSARGGSIEISSDTLQKAKLPKTSLEGMFRSLEKWIRGLEPKDTGEITTWQEYAGQTSYDDEDTQRKREVVGRFVSEFQPELVWDLGCNSGEYSELALEKGASHVVGWDFDQGALAAAFDRSRDKQLPLTTLYFDATNPSPSQGWAQSERQGMLERGPADGILALAFVHHLAIARNLPLGHVADWLSRLGRGGVVEFVAKDDPMVQKLLSMREDIFPDYTLDAFVDQMGRHAEIVRVDSLKTRHLVTYRVKS